jgi:uncharacterized membrane protein YccC
MCLGGFILIWALTTLIILVASLPFVQNFISESLANIVALLFGASLAITVAQCKSLNSTVVLPWL